MNFRKTATSILLVTLLGVTLTACSQDKINIPTESDAPVSYPYGSTTQTGENTGNENSNPSDPANPDSDGTDSLNPNLDPAATLPKIDKSDAQYDIKASLVEDIETTRQYIVIVGELREEDPKNRLDATATGATTTINEETFPYIIQITDPNTTIKVEGTITSGYTITASNSTLENFTITFNSTKGYSTK